MLGPSTSLLFMGIGRLGAAYLGGETVLVSYVIGSLLVGILLTDTADFGVETIFLADCIGMVSLGRDN